MDVMGLIKVWYKNQTITHFLNGHEGGNGTAETIGGWNILMIVTPCTFVHCIKECLKDAEHFSA